MLSSYVRVHRDTGYASGMYIGRESVPDARGIAVDDPEANRLRSTDRSDSVLKIEHRVAYPSPPKKPPP
jgi:hypothetical protein